MMAAALVLLPHRPCGRALTGAPRAARSSLAGKFACAWRDNRVNRVRPTPYFDVYTRVVPSM